MYHVLRICQTFCCFFFIASVISMKSSGFILANAKLVVAGWVSIMVIMSSKSQIPDCCRICTEVTEISKSIRLLMFHLFYYLDLTGVATNIISILQRYMPSTPTL